MPQAIDITLKNGAGTPADKTFTLMAPAAGDNSFANWRLQEGPNSTVFPAIAVRAFANANARKVQIKFRMPAFYNDVATGLTKVSSAYDATLDIAIPFDFPQVNKADAVAFLSNLLQNAMIKAVLKDGYPTT